jgi:DNA-binding NarL/FixJ family response regulator
MDNNSNNKSSTPTTTSTNASYFSLVITDIRMPGLNGIQLYQILKALCPNVKILFISALDAAQELVTSLPIT